MHSWGKFMKKNYYLPTKKTQAPLLRYLEQKQGTAHALCTYHNQNSGQTT